MDVSTGSAMSLSSFMGKPAHSRAIDVPKCDMLLVCIVSAL